jgi:hypothetical protein
MPFFGKQTMFIKFFSAVTAAPSTRAERFCAFGRCAILVMPRNLIPDDLLAAAGAVNF